MPIKDLAFDHRIYLSLAGPVALAVVGLYVLARKVLPKEASPLLYTAAATLVLVAAVGLGAKTYQRNFAFRDSIALWRDTLQSRPRNVRALYNLALFLSDKGEVAEAEKLYREAIGVKADYADAHNNLANILAGQGRYPEAIDHFELAIQFDPELAQAHNNYAGVLAQMAMRSPPGSPSFDHNMARSREHYEQALRLRDDYPLARCNFATILARLGKPAEAAEQYRRVLAEHPDFPRAHAELAGIDEMEGRPAEAIAHLRLAVKYRMDWPEFLLHAAWTFATSDDPSLADGKEALEAALRVCKDENNAQHMDVLAAAYAQAGQFDRAVDRADRAAALARVAGHADQAAAIAERLDLYKSRKPYREQVVTTAPASQPDRQ